MSLKSMKDGYELMIPKKVKSMLGLIEKSWNLHRHPRPRLPALAFSTLLCIIGRPSWRSFSCPFGFLRSVLGLGKDVDAK